MSTVAGWFARDSIYPGWMSWRACLPGTRFIQVECHAGLDPASFSHLSTFEIYNNFF